MRKIAILVAGTSLLLGACSSVSDTEDNNIEELDNDAVEEVVETKVAEEEADSVFNYIQHQEVVNALNNVKHNYELLLENPEENEETWEDYKTYHSDVYNNFVDDLKEANAPQTVIDAMRLVNESVALVDTFNEQRQNNEDIEEITAQIEDVFVNIEELLGQTLEAASIEVTEDMTAEFTDRYRELLDYLSEKNFTDFAGKFVDERKELIIEEVDEQLTGHTVSYKVLYSEIVEAYEDAVALRVKTEFDYEAEEGNEQALNDAEVSSVVYFVNTNDEWKVYKVTSFSTEEL